MDEYGALTENLIHIRNLTALHAALITKEGLPDCDMQQEIQLEFVHLFYKKIRRNFIEDLIEQELKKEKDLGSCF
jgi:hypothetical protein